MDKKNILIASEDCGLHEKIKRELADDNVAFASALGERMAMDMIAAKEYCAVIVDVDLTAVSSYDLLYRLGILRHTMPIIAISSQLDADNILLAYDFGVIDIIDKSFAPGELSAIIDKIYNIAV